MAEQPTIDHKAMSPPPLPARLSLPSTNNAPTFSSGTPAISSPHGPGPGANSNEPIPVSPPWHATGPQLRTYEPNEEDQPLFTGFTVFTALPSWLASMMVHLTLMLLTAFLFFPISEKPNSLDLVLGDASQPAEELDELDTVEIAIPNDFPDSEPELEIAEQEVVIDPAVNFESMDQIDIVNASLHDVSDLATELNTRARSSSGKPATIAGGLGLRNAKSRLQQVLDAGGTKGSEAAVARALKWIASQQRDDGGWDMAAGKPGFIETRGRNGATGLALLPFLGAGHTHKSGRYKDVVQRGIYYLLGEMDIDGLGVKAKASLTDTLGTYYAHGLCTIALCEDYAMTRDVELRVPAQQLLNEIVDAQDPSGGGWRYRRREPGDTSVLGWQLMALKSGKMAYLEVPDATFRRASRFLDSVQSDYGSSYGYTAQGRRPSTSAVGLLSRMYLGWDRDHKPLERGVKSLNRLGPDEDEIYFSYYATQVLHHYGGPKWERWNEEMRDSLVNSQTRGGANEGSWLLRAAHHRSRLYCTSLATMILEVYYRHMPLYGAQAADGQPL